jgi:hypothetical protein
MQQDLIEKIVSLCKRRGFVFPGSEIYGGLANSWDYGPLGTELKNNIKQLWWKRFELMEKLKEEHLAQESIYIILSNRGQASDIARGESLGAAGYIVKASSTPSEVIEKVNSIISNIKK